MFYPNYIEMQKLLGLIQAYFFLSLVVFQIFLLYYSFTSPEKEYHFCDLKTTDYVSLKVEKFEEDMY